MTITIQSPAVEDLARRLATLARVNGVIVITDDTVDGTYSYADPCTGVRHIVVGDLAGDRMAGALAHEIAHHRLGHDTRPRPLYVIHRWTGYGVIGSVVGGSAVPALVVPAFWVAAVLMAISLAAFLAAMAGERREEYAADEWAVADLYETGLDGRAVMEASLTPDPQPWWYRAGGWLIHTHPTYAARLRRIRAISPANKNARPVLSHRTGS